MNYKKLFIFGVLPVALILSFGLLANPESQKSRIFAQDPITVITAITTVGEISRGETPTVVKTTSAVISEVETRVVTRLDPPRLSCKANPNPISVGESSIFSTVITGTVTSKGPEKWTGVFLESQDSGQTKTMNTIGTYIASVELVINGNMMKASCSLIVNPPKTDRKCIDDGDSIFAQNTAKIIQISTGKIIQTQVDICTERGVWNGAKDTEYFCKDTDNNGVADSIIQQTEQNCPNKNFFTGGRCQLGVAACNDWGRSTQNLSPIQNLNPIQRFFRWFRAMLVSWN